MATTPPPQPQITGTITADASQPPAAAQSTDPYALSEPDRQRLDSLIQRMQANHESDTDILAVVKDFKQRYGASPSPANGNGNWDQNPIENLIHGVAWGAAHTTAELGSHLAGSVGDQAQQKLEELDANPPQGVAAKIGKFGEQAAEFVAPSAGVADALEAAPAALRMLGQAGVGAGVSSVQSEGNPTATTVGAVLGGAGEGLGSAVGSALFKNAPTIENFAKSFGATPVQKIQLSKALPTLVKDGIQPTDSPLAMQDAIEGKLQDLGGQYQALPKDIPTRAMAPNAIIADLKAQQMKFAQVNSSTGEIHVANSQKAAFNQLQGEIDDVRQLAQQNGGQITFDNLRYLRDGANGKTNFLSPQADQQLYRSIGDTYRAAMDQLAPETTQLNRDYATYKGLQSLVDRNVSMQRGVTPSMLQQIIDKSASKTIGAGLGYTAGHTLGGPIAGDVGGVIGAWLYPKVSSAVFQALKNASDNGALQALNPLKQGLLKAALAAGDNGKALAILGAQTGAEEGTVQLSRKN